MQNISIWTSRQTSVPIDIVRTTGLGNIRGRTISGNFSGKLVRSLVLDSCCADSNTPQRGIRRSATGVLTL